MWGTSERVPNPEIDRVGLVLVLRQNPGQPVVLVVLEHHEEILVGTTDSPRKREVRAVRYSLADQEPRGRRKLGRLLGRSVQGGCNLKRVYAEC